MTKIIGFDVSSSCIGWGIVELKSKSISYVDSGIIIPKKKIKQKVLSIFERLDFVKKEIIKLLDKHNPDEFAIEDIIYYIARRSTAVTVITLGIYNRFVGHTIFEKYKNPKLIPVITIRNKIKIKRTPKKEEIPSVLEKQLNIKFPIKYDKKGKIHKYTYDRSDGVAVALAYAMILLEKVEKN